MNKFLATMKSLEGKTIKSVDDVKVEYNDDYQHAIRITTTDDLVVTVGIDSEDMDMVILDESNSEDVTWTCSYSKRRHEVYIYNAEGNQVFMIPEEQQIHGMEYMNDIQLRKCIEENYSDVLSDMGLI